METAQRKRYTCICEERRRYQALRLSYKKNLLNKITANSPCKINLGFFSIVFNILSFLFVLLVRSWHFLKSRRASTAGHKVLYTHTLSHWLVATGRVPPMQLAGNAARYLQCSSANSANNIRLLIIIIIIMIIITIIIILYTFLNLDSLN